MLGINLITSVKTKTLQKSKTKNRNFEIFFRGDRYVFGMCFRGDISFDQVRWGLVALRGSVGAWLAVARLLHTGPCVGDLAVSRRESSRGHAHARARLGCLRRYSPYWACCDGYPIFLLLFAARRRWSSFIVDDDLPDLVAQKGDPNL